jgi:hypothetical protein
MSITERAVIHAGCIVFMPSLCEACREHIAGGGESHEHCVVPFAHHLSHRNPQCNDILLPLLNAMFREGCKTITVYVRSVLCPLFSTTVYTVSGK